MRYKTTAVETREWNYTDKSSWGDGEWQDEPDKMQWTDEETGLPCLIVRNPGGALCGYAGVPKSHPWFQKDYGDCLQGCKPDEDGWTSCYAHSPDGLTEVHGGITFASMCEPHKDDPERGICHVITGDEEVWWFGFDCAHSGDLCPERLSRDPEWREWNATYKRVAYVRRYVTSLARKLNAPESLGQEED